MQQSQSRSKAVWEVGVVTSCLVAVLTLPSLARAGDGSVDASNGDTDFSVNFRFPPTAQQIAEVKAAVDLMAFGLCDATDGNLRVRRVRLLQGQATEDLGDYWLQASNFRAGGLVLRRRLELGATVDIAEANGEPRRGPRAS